MEKRTRDPKTKAEETAETASTATAGAVPAEEGGGDPRGPLRDDAAALRAALESYPTTAAAERESTCRAIASAWLVHEALVDEFLLSVPGAGATPDPAVEDHRIEVDTTKILIRALAEVDDEARRAALMRALVPRIERLLDAEEALEGGLFARIEIQKSPDLAARIETRRVALERGVMTSPPMLTRLGAALSEKRNRQEYDVMRSSNMRERDDHGRFV